MSGLRQNFSISEAVRRAADFFLVLSFFYISFRATRDYRSGGNSWKQGDWLINNAGGEVRRGHIGSAIIYISDILNLELLFVVVSLQIMLLLTLFVTFRKLMISIGNPMISSVLLISPAIFTVFWLADPQGSMRKELIAFVGLSLCALATTRDSRLLFWCGVVLLCIGFLSHEAMVLFTPLFLGVVFLSRTLEIDSKHLISACAVVLSCATYVTYFAITNSQALNVNLVCSPLLERGLDEAICDGAIRAVAHERTFSILVITNRHFLPSLGGFLVAYTIALAPFVYLIMSSQRPAGGLILLIVTGLPFVPLYFIAADWGRWVSFHIFSLAILAACLMIHRNLKIDRNLSSMNVFLLIVISLLISPDHVIGIHWGGALRGLSSYF